MSSPGGLLPLGVLSLPEADLVQLSEEGVRDVLLVIVLRAQQELHTLGRGVRWGAEGGKEGGREEKKEGGKQR